MVGEIKPIETIYSGYRFRSRLEAKWAVYFDASHIKFEYEPEGYYINNRGYLPDFWLPEFECFLEVKPPGTTDLKLYRDFINTVGKAIILVQGPPWEYIATWFGWETNDCGGGCCELDCVIASSMALIIDRDHDGTTLFVSEWETNGNVVPYFHYKNMTWDDCVKMAASLTFDAYTKAKYARFEHGEHGGSPTEHEESIFEKRERLRQHLKNAGVL